jgi:hypothetical protein
MHELVHAWDLAVIRHGGLNVQECREEIRGSRSVLRPPASEAEVRDAELRLGIRLPPSYRAFLLVSNGAYAGLGGALFPEEVQLRDPLPLLAVENVVWLRDAVPWLVEGWTELEERNEPATQERVGEPPWDVAYFMPLQRALMIGGKGDYELLIPSDTGADWESWNFTKDGALAYPSFADRMRSDLSLPFAEPHRRDEYEVAARQMLQGDRTPTDWLALEHLAVLDPDAAVKVAMEILALPAHLSSLRLAVEVLRQIGDSKAVPSLRAALDLDANPPEPGNRLKGQVLQALVSCRDPDVRALLEQTKASDPDALMCRHAESLLARFGAR